MIRSCITVSLVEEARGGPFVFWDGLDDACRRAAALGFDAIEIFPPSPQSIDPRQLAPLLERYQLRLAAVGTGAGWLKHRFSLTARGDQERKEARAFVKQIIDVAATFGASAIIGSMQGPGDGPDRVAARRHLTKALEELGHHAAEHKTQLFFEPLNRYETKLCNTLAEGTELLESLSCRNVLLLADLFHMNIEEQDIAGALLLGGRYLGHLHFVDSNRRPATCGHLDYRPIAAALREIGYAGYASAEALPYPDSQAAAESTINAFREFLA